MYRWSKQVTFMHQKQFLPFARKRDDSKILSTKQSFLIFKEYIDRIINVAETIVLYLNPIKNGDELKVG